MIYEQRHYDISPGYRKEFLIRFKEIVLPDLIKLGVKVIGVWETPIGDRNRVIALLGYADMAERMDIWDKFQKTEAFSKMPRLSNSVQVSILRPSKYSPMK